jgi:hypothetical protein
VKAMVSEWEEERNSARQFFIGFSRSLINSYH